MWVDAGQIDEYIGCRFPPRVARRLIRAWYALRFRFDATVEATSQARLVGLALGEPDAIAWRIAREAWLTRGMQRLTYAQLARYGAGSSLPQIEDLEARAWTVLGSDTAPRVIVTLHAGNYLEGFLALLPLIPRHQPLHIIKLASATEQETAAYRAFGHLGHQVHVHRLHEHPAGRVVRELRRTRGVLNIFVDVPPELGQTRPVTLFGRRARIVAGPILLGLLSGAIVVPAFSVLGPGGSSSVRLGRPLTCARLAGESHEAAIVRLAQALVRQVEAHVRAYPQQWALWPVLATLFESGDAECPPVTVDPASRQEDQDGVWS